VKFDSPTDGLVYGVVASMGFAALENLFYVYDGGFEVAAMRAITAVPSHALHGAIMGYFITLSHYLPERRALYLFQAITVPIFLHGLYDFPLFAAGRLPEGLAAAVLLNLGNLPVLSIELGVVIVLFRRVRSVHAKAAIHAGECTASELLRTVHRKASLASSAIAWFLLMFGGVLAWFGSLATVFALTATFSDQPTPGTVDVQIVSAGVIILALLTALGVFIFRKGVSRLNRLAVAH